MQVEKWTWAQLRAFWERWYFPANATLFVVGDVDPEVVRAEIQRSFGRIPTDRHRDRVGDDNGTLTLAEPKKRHAVRLFT